MINQGSIGVQPTLKSDPPTGKYKVINLYVDPATGKLIIEYDDIPEE